MNIHPDFLCARHAQQTHGPRMAPRPKVGLGRLCIKPGIARTIPAAEILAALAKHVSGDWGDLPPPELAANRRALSGGDPVCSLHACSRGKRLWIATETDLGVTTVLLANDH